MGKSRKVYHADFDPRSDPLVRACANGELKKAQELVKLGVPVNAIGHKRWGYYPLHAAAENGHVKIVDYLITIGAKLDVRTAAEYQRDLMTPLLLAAEKNRFGIVKLLVQAGADINAHSAFNSTAIGHAIQKRNREMFDYLIAHGARAEVKDLNLAVGRGDTNLVQWFLNHGFKLDQEEFELDQSHLSNAIFRNDFEMVKFLIEHGADVNRAKNHFAEPPLVQAARERKWDIANYLLKKGANPNMHSIHDAYALNYAARLGGLEIAPRLIRQGAKVDTVDFEGKTPLDWSIENKDKQMFELLVKHGAPVPQKLVLTIKRRFGKEALRNAVISRSEFTSKK